ncbi:MAG: 3-deoxy-D-manno-octulosonate cytidylyltransferase [Myxococcota bacterium]
MRHQEAGSVMTERETVLAVIPARLGSTRLAAKVLVDIGGRPMLWWVWRLCLRAAVDDVVVATDSDRVADAARGFGARVVLTGAHTSGTDRVAAVASGSSHNWVIGVQADEPLLDPGVVTALVRSLRATGADMVTPCCAISAGEIGDPSAVKCAFDEDGRALWFERERSSGHRHLGLYGWRRAALLEFATLPPHPDEITHGLEQLRALRAGLDVRVVEVDRQAPGVDTPADLAAVREALRRRVDSCMPGSAG